MSVDFITLMDIASLITFLDYMNECINKLKGKKMIWIGDINVDQNKINCPE